MFVDYAKYYDATVRSVRSYLETREALLNAIVRRDYSINASTLISMVDDRIVSIGGLVKGISFDDMMLEISVVRNQHIANIFYRLKIFGSREAIAMKDIEIALNVSQTTAVLIIREIVPNGQLIKNGNGKYERYMRGNL